MRQAQTGRVLGTLRDASYRGKCERPQVTVGPREGDASDHGPGEGGPLLDIWAVWIAERRVLDLFGGTGAVGIEALSRGAAHVHFMSIGAVRRCERWSATWPIAGWSELGNG